MCSNHIAVPSVYSDDNLVYKEVINQYTIWYKYGYACIYIVQVCETVCMHFFFVTLKETNLNN